jgi:hypothetical protein
MSKMRYNELMKGVSEVTQNNESGNPSKCFVVPEQLFRRLLVIALKAKGGFDEKFYLSQHPDIREAVRNGQWPSGAEHYYRAGYFENRLPSKIKVDEEYYLKQYPDVAEGVKKRRYKSGQEHFERDGFSEGRKPYQEDLSLFPVEENAEPSTRPQATKVPVEQPGEKRGFKGLGWR